MRKPTNIAIKMLILDDHRVIIFQVWPKKYPKAIWAAAHNKALNMFQIRKVFLLRLNKPATNGTIARSQPINRPKKMLFKVVFSFFQKAGLKKFISLTESNHLSFA